MDLEMAVVSTSLPEVVLVPGGKQATNINSLLFSLCRPASYHST